MSIYGETKLEGEQAIQASGCAHIILRTTWVYDIRGKNFLRTVIAIGAGEGKSCASSATNTAHRPGPAVIAEATSIILGRCLEHKSETGDWRTGIFHLTASGQTSWAGFAQAILEEYETPFGPSEGSGEFGAPLKTQTCQRLQPRSIPRRRAGHAIRCSPTRRCKPLLASSMPDWRDQLRLAMQDAIRR